MGQQGHWQWPTLPLAPLRHRRGLLPLHRWLNRHLDWHWAQQLTLPLRWLLAAQAGAAAAAAEAEAGAEAGVEAAAVTALAAAALQAAPSVAAAPGAALMTENWLLHLAAVPHPQQLQAQPEHRFALRWALQQLRRRRRCHRQELGPWVDRLAAGWLPDAQRLPRGAAGSRGW